MRRSERKREELIMASRPRGLNLPRRLQHFHRNKSGWVRPEGISLSVARPVEVLSRFVPVAGEPLADRVFEVQET